MNEMCACNRGECSICYQCENEYRNRIGQLESLVDAAPEFVFAEEHGDEVYVAKRNGHTARGWRWEVHVSSCTGGSRLAFFEGEGARERAIAEACKRANMVSPMIPNKEQ